MKNVVAFSGGRASETFLKAWNSKRPFNLDLLVNPYDDGLSTGRIRDFIPGFLGPSDFRKNLVHYLYSSGNIADTFFARKLEQRINTLNETKTLFNSDISAPFLGSFEGQTETLVKAIKKFELYEKNSLTPFNYADCALGNIVLAGLYLENGFDFQRAVSELINIFKAEFGLFTVSNQNDISLVAITSNREFLAREHLIVNGLYTGAVIHLGFIATSKLLDNDFFYSGIRTEADLSEIDRFFVQPMVCLEAAGKLHNADLVCYLPGTQNSSLFPSYRILKKEIQSSNALTKVLVMNLTRDHDMSNWRRSDILINALFHLGDPNNSKKSVTHVLLNRPSHDASLLDGPIREVCENFEIELIARQLANSSSPSFHSGEAIIETLKELI